MAVAALALVGGLAACGGESGTSDPENIVADDGGIILDDTPTSDSVDEAPVEDAPAEDAPAEEAPVEEEAPADEESTG